MPFELRWAQIPLRVRWAISLIVAAALMVGLVLFVSHPSNNVEVNPSKARLRQEYQIDRALVEQQQAPHVVRVRSPAAAAATLAVDVRRLMNAQVTANLLPGPVQRVRCFENARGASKIGYHCLGEADDITYPFVAVLTPRARVAVFCKLVYAPVASENIPLPRSCQLTS